MPREIATMLLQEAKPIDETYCSVGTVRVLITQKDILLQQLLKDKDDLHVPPVLYCHAPFWRELKANSNQRKKANATRTEEIHSNSEKKGDVE